MASCKVEDLPVSCRHTDFFSTMSSMYVFLIFILTECTNYCPNKKHKATNNVDKLIEATTMKITESFQHTIILKKHDNRKNVFKRNIVKYI